ncbi:MAG: transglycosylase domain-containing protein [Brachymonas sp.]|nr:transglycosylase domain-containing protein [Brachymonas sp.]
MKALARTLGWVLLAGLLLQLYFMARIGLMRVVDPQSTAFQRSEMVQVTLQGKMAWSQQWVPYENISDNLKRAVIASEDGGFLEHEGIDWDAIEEARTRNAAAAAQAQKKQERLDQRQKQVQERAQRRIERLQKQGKPIDPALQAAASGASAPPPVSAKVVGASTISQQLAKNLLLSGERSLFRKGQEVLLTYYLEWFLGKRRILEIYLNNVEWGQGIFGAEAAARYYFHKPAAQLSASEAARLAVMLPRPKFFEGNMRSGYLASRAGTIAGWMQGVEIP